MKVDNILTNLRIARSKHQYASASFSRSITIGEQISFIPAHKINEIHWSGFHTILHHVVQVSLNFFFGGGGGGDC